MNISIYTHSHLLLIICMFLSYPVHANPPLIWNINSVPNFEYQLSYNTGRLSKFSQWDKKEKIVVDIRRKAFAAYNEHGELVRWGPVSAGKDCNYRPYNCSTKRGKYRVFRKGDTTCESTIFPPPNGGAPMPYCMFFNKGIALHAGNVPGVHASHGCVRLLYEDAEWLNLNFVEPGTRVIIQ